MSAFDVTKMSGMTTKFDQFERIAQGYFFIIYYFFV